MGNRLLRFNVIKYLFVLALLILDLFIHFTYNGILTYLFTGSVMLVVISDFFFCKGFKRKGVNSAESEDIQSEVRRINKESAQISNELIQKIHEIKRELKVKNDELDALRDASAVVTSTFELNEIIEYIYKVFNKFTGCDRYLISFVDKETNTLICRYEFGSVCFDEVGKKFDEGSVLLDSFKKVKTIRKTNIFISKRQVYGDKMAIPLLVSGKVVGVVFMETEIAHNFENVNVGFLENLAAYVAIAVKNAELFNNIYIQKQEIEALYEETAAVNEELSSYIEELDETKEELKSKNEELTVYFSNMQTGYIQTVMSLSNAIEAKDPYTRGHCQRVMEVACEIGRRLEFDDNQIADLRYAAILHDIGKIGISASIINKGDKLTESEYNEIKKHPSIAYNILKDVEFLKKGLEGILQHHERYDGEGYPHGLKEKNICLFGRILCISDALDAMTSDRPYRKAMSFEAAVAEIKKCRGTQFDPEITDLFLDMSRDLLNFKFEMQGETC